MTNAALSPKKRHKPMLIRQSAAAAFFATHNTQHYKTK